MSDQEAEVLEALRDLVEQVRLGEYRDELGHDLRMNVAFRAAAAVLLARGLIE